ncbi:class D beta-lactamase [Shewanella sp. Isolate13]|uniref:class D beta-lactamase n=1 Tax=Shewanella sp. Isolate13 TaxID=2908531 RepID=UPI001EFC7579|nr:class D beta-lactamase [Shewanella sp. Isolate13]MCG9730227.1 class D beta-lactamase [Shewanella sp. Isolate13]
MSRRAAPFCGFAIALSVLLITPFHVSAALGERPDWQQYFAHHDAKGTIVVRDERGEKAETWVVDSKRAQRRLSPASTYKIPHTLFALDAKLVKDEFQIFKWDGVKRGFSPHNQDQNLRSAMRYSAVWVYDGFAKQLGERKARQYLTLLDYGNADPTFEKAIEDSDSYWIDGKLAISAVEQVEFLQKLYRNQLPFELSAQLLVKDIMINEAGNDWILRAKTGWQGRYGWWVGWVEWPTGPVYFALNIDTPNRMKDLYKREAIVREILQSIEALPVEP